MATVSAFSAIEPTMLPAHWQQLAGKEPHVGHGVSRQEVLSLMPVGVVLLSPKGRVVEANPVAIDLLGIPLLGENWRDIIVRAFQPRDDDGHEVSLRDGRRVQLTTRALSDGEGQLVTLTDLTETRALQARLAQRERLAGIGQVMASLAHQLRTPIASSMLNLYQLQRQLPEGGEQKYVKRLNERLQYMERQITDMLLVAGGGQLRVEPIAVGDIVARVQELCAPLFASHKVSFQVHLESEDSVIGHRDALVGAVANLVENALHACLDVRERREGVVQLNVMSIKTRVVFEVTDNGCGMNELTQQRLHEPFFSTKRTGTGLGLAVVHTVCESHQAELDVSSAPDVGSAFRISLARVARATMRRAM